MVTVFKTRWIKMWNSLSGSLSYVESTYIVFSRGYELFKYLNCITAFNTSQLQPFLARSSKHFFNAWYFRHSLQEMKHTNQEVWMTTQTNKQTNKQTKTGSSVFAYNSLMCDTIWSTKTPACGPRITVLVCTCKSACYRPKHFKQELTSLRYHSFTLFGYCQNALNKKSTTVT